MPGSHNLTQIKIIKSMETDLTQCGVLMLTRNWDATIMSGCVNAVFILHLLKVYR